MTTTTPRSMARLYWLALGTFAIGTEGFMIAPRCCPIWPAICP